MDSITIIAVVSIITAGLTIALGSIGPALGEGRAVSTALSSLAQQPDASATITRTGAASGYATNVERVFVAGDMGRGQSLIVWAIAESVKVRPDATLDRCDVVTPYAGHSYPRPHFTLGSDIHPRALTLAFL